MIFKPGRVFLACCVIGAYACVGYASTQRGDRKVNPDALVLQDFTKRVDRYIELRKKLQKHAPRLEETKNPADIALAQKALGEQLRAARREARPGDIFTPAIRAKFRQLMSAEVTGPDRRATTAAIKDEQPARVPLKVNATYPENEPLPTVPPNILANLPRLPEALEYRIVGTHLILRDVDANIIVDYIPNAIR